MDETMAGAGSVFKQPEQPYTLEQLKLIQKLLNEEFIATEILRLEPKSPSPGAIAPSAPPAPGAAAGGAGAASDDGRASDLKESSIAGAGEGVISEGADKRAPSAPPALSAAAGGAGAASDDRRVLDPKVLSMQRASPEFMAKFGAHINEQVSLENGSIWSLQPAYSPKKKLALALFKAGAHEELLTPQIIQMIQALKEREESELISDLSKIVSDRTKGMNFLFIIVFRSDNRLKMTEAYIKACKQVAKEDAEQKHLTRGEVDKKVQDQVDDIITSAIWLNGSSLLTHLLSYMLRTFSDIWWEEDNSRGRAIIQILDGSSSFWGRLYTIEVYFEIFKYLQAQLSKEARMKMFVKNNQTKSIFELLYIFYQEKITKLFFKNGNLCWNLKFSYKCHLFPEGQECVFEHTMPRIKKATEFLMVDILIQFLKDCGVPFAPEARVQVDYPRHTPELFNDGHGSEVLMHVSALYRVGLKWALGAGHKQAREVLLNLYPEPVRPDVTNEDNKQGILSWMLDKAVIDEDEHQLIRKRLFDSIQKYKEGKFPTWSDQCGAALGMAIKHRHVRECALILQTTAADFYYSQSKIPYLLLAIKEYLNSPPSADKNRRFFELIKLIINSKLFDEKGELILDKDNVRKFNEIIINDKPETKFVIALLCYFCTISAEDKNRLGEVATGMPSEGLFKKTPEELAEIISSYVPFTISPRGEVAAAGGAGAGGAAQPFGGSDAENPVDVLPAPVGLSEVDPIPAVPVSRDPVGAPGPAGGAGAASSPCEEVHEGAASANSVLVLSQASLTPAVLGSSDPVGAPGPAGGAGAASSPGEEVHEGATPVDSMPVSSSVSMILSGLNQEIQAATESLKALQEQLAKIAQTEDSYQHLASAYGVEWESRAATINAVKDQVEKLAQRILVCKACCEMICGTFPGAREELASVEEKIKSLDQGRVLQEEHMKAAQAAFLGYQPASGSAGAGSRCPLG